MNIWFKLQGWSRVVPPSSAFRVIDYSLTNDSKQLHGVGLTATSKHAESDSVGSIAYSSYQEHSGVFRGRATVRWPLPPLARA